MSGNRVSLRECADWLKGDSAIMLVPGIRVDTIYAADYPNAIKSANPAIWVLGQRWIKSGDPHGYSGVQRQRGILELALRLVMPRSIPGVPDLETPMHSLHGLVVNRMYGWQINGTEEEFTVSHQQDGAPFETVVTADLKFAASMMFVN